MTANEVLRPWLVKLTSERPVLMPKTTGDQSQLFPRMTKSKRNFGRHDTRQCWQKIKERMSFSPSWFMLRPKIIPNTVVTDDKIVEKIALTFISILAKSDQKTLQLPQTVGKDALCCFQRLKNSRLNWSAIKLGAYKGWSPCYQHGYTCGKAL